MVQVLKESIRNQIAEAAEHQFAKVGFTNATIGTIAKEAGVATGTVYKYYQDKTALFQAILPEKFVSDFSELTLKRVAAFARPEGLKNNQDLMKDESGELIRFFANNRLKVIILLGWGEDTPYGNFAQKYINEMEKQTMKQVQEQFPQIAVTQTFRFMVNKMLTDSVRGIISILSSFEDEAAIKNVFMVTTKCQIAAINRLIQFALHGE